MAKRFPSPSDATIDELGSETNVKSPADARRYIDALIERYGLDGVPIRDFESLKARLVASEFAAVRTPSKRIREETVAKAFNQVMDLWGTPAWSRISPEELHVFRIVIATTRFPKITTRSGGHVAGQCRPVEALLIIYLLESNHREIPIIRKEIESGSWLGEDMFVERNRDRQVELRPARGSAGRLQADQGYLAARSQFVQENVDQDLSEWISELFASLGIESGGRNSIC